MQRFGLHLAILVFLASVPSTLMGESIFPGEKEKSAPTLGDVDAERKVLRESFQKKDELYKSLAESKETIVFDAVQQEFIPDEHIYKGWGYVRVSQGQDFVLEAESVVYNQWTGELTAEGGVTIHFVSDVITGSRAEFNLQDQRGVVYNCRAYLDPDLYIEADIFEKLPPDDKTAADRYYIEKGTFSSCEPNPIYDWKIKAGKAYGHQEHYLQLYNSSFWIWRIPIFYFPYWIHPIKTERSTGFLIPSAGYSSDYGYFMQNAFFWAFSDYADVTFHFDTFSKAGSAQYLKLRYNLSQRSQNNELIVTHMEERQPLDDVRKETGVASITNEPSEIWQMEWNHHQILWWDIGFNARFQYLNTNYLNDDLSSTAGAGPSYLQQDLLSTVSLKKSWRNKYLYLEGQSFHNLRAEEPSRIILAPSLTYEITNQKIFVKNLYYNLYVRGESVLKQTTESVTIPTSGTSYEVKDTLEKDMLRVNLNNSIKYVFNEWAWLTITPQIGLQETWWSDRKTAPDSFFPSGTWLSRAESDELAQETGFLQGQRAVGEGLLRSQYYAVLELKGPEIYRMFDLPVKRMGRWKHLIEPVVRYIYYPKVESWEIIDIYSSFPLRTESNIVSFSLSNKLVGKYYDSYDKAENKRNGKWKPLVFATLRIATTYDFNKLQEKNRKIRAGETVTRADEPLGLITVDLDIRPFSHLNLRNTYLVDPNEHYLRRATFDGHVQRKNWLTDFRLYYDWGTLKDTDTDDTATVSLGFRAQLSPRWIVEGSETYDIMAELAQYTALSVTYHSQCWGITLSSVYKQQKLSTLSDEIDEDIDFQFSFHLKNLGDIGTSNIRRYSGGY